MGRSDWFRHSTWSEAIALDFEARLTRSRAASASKYRYCHTQASLLAREQLFAPAAALYTRSLTFEADDTARRITLHELGNAQLALGDLGAAEQSFRAAITTQPAAERFRFNARRTSPEDDLIRVLHYTHASPEAEIDAIERPRRIEREPRLGALRTAPLREIAGGPLTDPESAAESLLIHHHVLDHFSPDDVDALFRADRAALAALDRRNLELPARYRIHSLDDAWHAYLPCLAAYVGRVLVREGATWVDDGPPWRLVVVRGGARVDLLRIAYRAMWDDVPLCKLVAELG